MPDLFIFFAAFNADPGIISNVRPDMYCARIWVVKPVDVYDIKIVPV